MEEEGLTCCSSLNCPAKRPTAFRNWRHTRQDTTDTSKTRTKTLKPNFFYFYTIERRSSPISALIAVLHCSLWCMSNDLSSLLAWVLHVDLMYLQWNMAPMGTSVMNHTGEVAGYLPCRMPPRFPWTVTWPCQSLRIPARECSVCRPPKFQVESKQNAIPRLGENYNTSM